MRFENNDLIFPNVADPCLVYLKNVVDSPDVIVGDHTFYHDYQNDPRDFQKNNVLYPWPELGHDRLIIGRYCSIACKSKFMMVCCGHDLTALCNYPFPMGGEKWGFVPSDVVTYFDRVCARKGPTIIGNDVWLGYDCLVMPGVTVGDGASVGTRSVVTKDVPPYTVVAGNPARPVRKRFDDDTIETLMALKWWDLPDHQVREILPGMISGKIDDVMQRHAFGDKIDLVLDRLALVR